MIQDWDSYWTVVPKQSLGSASSKSKLYFCLPQSPTGQRTSKTRYHKHSAHKQILQSIFVQDSRAESPEGTNAAQMGMVGEAIDVCLLTT